MRLTGSRARRSVVVQVVAALALLTVSIRFAAVARSDPPSPPGRPQIAAGTTGGPLTERARSTGEVWSGVVAAPGGRLFVVLRRLVNTGPLSLAEIGEHGDLIPYPDARWNGTDNSAPHHAQNQKAGPVFIGLNAIRLAPDGALWAVDTGIPGFGRQPVPGGARLIRIDLATNQVTQVLTVPPDQLRPKSLLGELRFNGEHAYVTDAGAPGLIVLDLPTGNVRRVLDRDPALTAQRPLTVDGEALKGPDGKPAMIDVERLEVTPDGRNLYLQPPCGPMVRVPTALLDDPQVPAATLSAGVVFWYDTPSLGGTAIAPDGTLYLNDLETDSILSLSPSRVLTRVIRDPRLHGAGVPSLAPDGTLFVPVSQLDRAAPFHHGHAQFQFPVMLFTLKPAELFQAPQTRSPPLATPSAAPSGQPRPAIRHRAPSRPDPDSI